MSDKRLRSPSYPSMPLEDAIETITKMFNELRTSSVDREVAAQAMGYARITGRSGKVLSNLVQYGLLSKSGKNEVKVSDRTVSILHPDDEAEKAGAILDAAYEPELFQDLRDKFSEGVLSENAIKSYLVKRGFTDAALPPAIRAYVDTYHFAEQFAAYDSHGHSSSDVEESVQYQNVEDKSMQTEMTQTAAPSVVPTVTAIPSEAGPQFNIISMSNILLGGSLTNQSEAQELIDLVTAVMPLMPKKETDGSELI